MNFPAGIAIAGVAESRLGEVPGVSAEELMVEAALAALDDAGLSPRDVDGLFSTSSYHFLPTMNLTEQMGVTPSYSDSTSLGGSSFVAYLGHAAAAISAGLCEVALITYGSTQRSDGGKLVSRSEQSSFELPLGYRYPISGYALAAARHMHQFGTTLEQLAEVAVASRQWAQLNPKAFTYGRPLSLEQAMASPVVSSPLRAVDCCLVTDGGAAFVVTKADRAKDLRQLPIAVLGVAEAHEHRDISEMRDLTSTAARITGPRALGEAGLTPADIDLVTLYDSFTINVPLFLEDLGFCAKGEGGPFVSGGRIAPGGALPVNPMGGGLSYTHPGMFGAFLVVEAVRQLRHEAGERQVGGAQHALVHGCGAVLSSHVTAVLGRS